MTATTELSPLSTPPRAHVSAVRQAAAWPLLAASSVLAFVVPPMSRIWRRASMAGAMAIAGINSLLAFGWLFAIVVCFNLYAPAESVPKSRNAPPAAIHGTWRPVAKVTHQLLAFGAQQWNKSDALDKASVIVGVAGLICTAYLIPFFVLLPMGARPGANRSCIRHVMRTVFLGSGLVHWWGPVFCAVMLGVDPLWTRKEGYTAAMFWLVSAFCVLVFWHLAVMVHAVRRDYRAPTDFPEPHDPWCDNCGYNLVMATDAGRCPECGRPVSASLGPDARPPTRWEERPGPFNFPVIAGQLLTLVRRPRKLFFSMPTLTGQPAAQRWLMGSMIIVGMLAALIVPAIYLAVDAEWNAVAIPLSAAMGLAWAVFGMMMVGIETLGIATFSRMRKQPPGGVYLAAAAKVTCYASILMIVWVVLGGVQLVTLIYWMQSEHNLVKVFHLSIRGLQMVLAGSLSVAHIGGLLWFELTVYRGVRAIQFANR